MKKLLSVSILAMLAVAPLAANATDAYPDATIYNSGENNDTTKVATTAYVKGAYNAANTNINAERVRVDNINTTIGSKTEGTHNILYGTGANVDNTIYGNLEKLETAVGELTTNAGSTYQTKANSEVTADMISDNPEGRSHLTAGQAVGTNLNALDNAIVTNEDNITTINNTIGSTAMGTTQATVTAAIAELNGDVGTTGSVLKKIKDNAESATFTTTNNTTNFVTTGTDEQKDNTIKKAVNRLDAKMGALTGLSDDAGLNGANAKDSVVNAINAVANTVKNNLSASAITTDGTYVKSNKNVSENLTALDTQVKTNADNIATNTTNISTNTTHIGTVGSLTTTAKTDLVSAVNEVNSKVLTVYSNWASGGTASGANTVALGVPTQQSGS